MDAGCGRGGTAGYLYGKGYRQIAGIDIDAQSISYARNRYPNIQFETANLETTIELSMKFDVIFMFNVLYAIDDRTACLSV